MFISYFDESHAKSYLSGHMNLYFIDSIHYTNDTTDNLRKITTLFSYSSSKMFKSVVKSNGLYFLLLGSPFQHLKSLEIESCLSIEEKEL